MMCVTCDVFDMCDVCDKVISDLVDETVQDTLANSKIDCS